MAANALMPARTSSVFLTGTASLALRNFKASKTANSGLGKVKLSRTILTFFTFSAFSTAALFVTAGVGFAAVFLLAPGGSAAAFFTGATGLAAALAGAFVDAFAGPFTASFAAVGAATLVAGFATAGAAAGVIVAGALGALVDCMGCFLYKRYIQFISFINIGQQYPLV